MDERKIPALSRPVASKTAAASSSRGNQQQEKMQHRTVINIQPNEVKWESKRIENAFASYTQLYCLFKIFKSNPIC
jgi:hypothetical protein